MCEWNTFLRGQKMASLPLLPSHTLRCSSLPPPTPPLLLHASCCTALLRLAGLLHHSSPSPVAPPLHWPHHFSPSPLSRSITLVGLLCRSYCRVSTPLFRQPRRSAGPPLVFPLLPHGPHPKWWCGSEVHNGSPSQVSVAPMAHLFPHLKLLLAQARAGLRCLNRAVE